MHRVDPRQGMWSKTLSSIVFRCGHRLPGSRDAQDPCDDGRKKGDTTMRHMLALTTAIACFCVAPANAKELSRVDFLSGQGRQAWSLNNLGDTKGVLVEAAGRPAFLFSATGGSWIFLQNNLGQPAGVLQEVKKVRATALVCSNHPERLQLVLSDGAAWGGLCTRYFTAAGKPNAAPSWQKIELEIQLKSETLLSAALGFDYQSPGAWACVSKIVIEGTASGDFSPFKDPIPNTTPELPAEIRKRIEGEGDFTWRSEPNPLFVFDAQTPVQSVRGDAIHLTAPANAKESALLLVSNPTSEVFNCTLAVQGDVSDKVDIYRYAYEDGNPDRPLRLNPEGLVELGRKETIGFELIFRTKGLKPGVYRGHVLVSPQNSGLAERTMPVTLTVAPVTLPARMPIATFTWDYGSALSDADLDFLLDARTNVFHLTAGNLAEISKAVAALRQRGYEPGSYQLMLETWHLRSKNKFDESDKAWMDSHTQRLAELGLKTNDWFFHIYDETLSPEFLSVAKAMKAHNPQVRIFSDAIGPVDTLKSFAPYVDYWCPLPGVFLDRRFSAELEYMRSTKKPIWFYDCDSMVSLPPANYRYHSWLAFHEKTQANTYWSALSTASRTPPGAPRYGMTYLNAKQEKQPSRRWFQWRAGMEDYLLLHLAASSGKPHLKKLADDLATKVCEARGTPTLGTTITQARRRLLEALSQSP